MYHMEIFEVLWPIRKVFYVLCFILLFLAWQRHFSSLYLLPKLYIQKRGMVDIDLFMICPFCLNETSPYVLKGAERKTYQSDFNKWQIVFR